MDVLNRIKLLMSYDSKKTLTENIENVLITEVGELISLAREGALVAKELEGVLKTMLRNDEIAKELSSLEKVSAGGVKTSDQLLTALKGNLLSAKAVGEMNLAILKSQTTNLKLIEAAAKDLVKSPEFAAKYYPIYRDGNGLPALEKALKDSGIYSERAITSITQQVEKDLTSFSKTAERGEQIAGKQKEKPPVEKEKIDPEKEDDLIRRSKKGEKWGDLLKKAALYGLSAYGLYQLLKGKDALPDPPPVPPVPPPVPPVPVPPVTKRYKDCGNGPFSKGCYEKDPNGPIHKAQACMGIISDGKFWTKTEQAVVNKLGKNTFTKDEVTKICGGSSTTTTTTKSVQQQFGTPTDSTLNLQGGGATEIEVKASDV